MKIYNNKKITLAKVGGLVGKVMEIDEKSRYRIDYVRMKIACRDFSKIPKTAEGVLGLSIYDFGFEREVLDDGKGKVLKSGIRIGEDQPPNKKFRNESGQDCSLMNRKVGDNDGPDSRQMQNFGKQVMASAPSKLQSTSVIDSGAKVMKDAQKGLSGQNILGGNDKVYIPEGIEDSDSESDSFGERLRKLNEEGQSSKQSKNQEHLWFMEVNENKAALCEESVADPVECMTVTTPKSVEALKNINVDKVSVSPEIFITDDNIVNTQESLALLEENPMEMEMLPDDQKSLEGDKKVVEKTQAVHPIARRRSESLAKEITIFTKEKTEMMAKKRNLEGICSNQNMFSVLPIDEMVELSSNMGVVIEPSNFGTFELLKDLECARHDLFIKQRDGGQTSQTSQADSAGIVDSSGHPLPIEWLHEEDSDSEDFILVLSKKKEREKRKSLKISPNLTKKKQILENPDLHISKSRRSTL